MAETTRPNKQSFDDIKELLLPLVENYNERSAFIKSALYGCLVLRQIDWSGSSSVFANHLIQKLIDFGQCEPSRPAIVLLLEELKLETGFEKHNQIDVLIEIYANEISNRTSDRDHPTSSDLMPNPFAWMNIPTGKVTLEKGRYIPGRGRILEVPSFAIAKYPITNSQFAKFIKAGGYREKLWWKEVGWLHNRAIEPDYWQDEKWNGADYPVVGVSWYEAMAFCQWLSDITKEKITLPTEQQWQWAAQGENRCIYPWGDQWEQGLCNTSEEQIGHTTPVHQYEGKGDSPYGVVDMAGNVWEWCLTGYDKDRYETTYNNEYRIVRGGCWHNPPDIARTGYRDDASGYPYSKNNRIGFRIVCLP